MNRKIKKLDTTIKKIWIEDVAELIADESDGSIKFQVVPHNE